MDAVHQRGQLTRREIFQQPDTWRRSVALIREAALGPIPAAVLTGAGTSAYAGMAVETAWNGSIAVPTTELFLDFDEPLSGRDVVVSFARSGNSPESVAVVEKIHQAHPNVRQVALTSNPDGALAKHPEVEAVLLDPRTNDRSLVMTSSFSNLVLGGLCLARMNEVVEALPTLCDGGETVLAKYDAVAHDIAASKPERVVFLASRALFGAAREGWLKILEMTAGRVVPLVETYLGVRHGPMSFIERETPVVCFLSSDVKRRRYEADLIKELKAKKLGRVIALGNADGIDECCYHVVSSEASVLPDYLRTPTEIIFAQLLGYHLSLELGLDPDNPSPSGVINRVVEGVSIYDD